MTHIRIRASLGGNIPRMSKILPFCMTPSYSSKYATSKSPPQLFVFDYVGANSSVADARLRQLRSTCAPKHQVRNAFCQFASITVFLPAFFPDAIDLVVVAAQIKGRVDNREETNCEYRDADRPHARLPPKIRRRRLKPSEAQARTIGVNASPR
jgi:hypothetical protein